MCRKLIAVCLAGCVLLSPLSALPSPPPSSSGASLSAEEIEAEAAMVEALEALDQSLAKIDEQKKDLKRLYLLCGALAIALAVDAAAHLVIAIKD
jgi:hypothetical protein